MTGLYPSRLHNTRNGNATFPENVPLISKLIADQGYDCGMIGKFHLQSAGKRTEPRLADDGFGFWKFSHAPRDDWPPGEHDYADWVREREADLDAMRERPERVAPELHQTAWATERALEFLSLDRGNRPWMLNINVYDPHPPFIPPKAYADRYSADTLPGPHFEPTDIAAQEELSQADFQTKSQHPDEWGAREAQANYYAMIEQIDEQFGRLWRTLEASGEAENTVIIFTSDHGETLGDHGLFYKGCRFYEGLTRVPLLIRGPGFAESLRYDHPVELLDLSATLLDIAGADIPSYHQGRSLLPILRREQSPEQPLRPFVRSEYFDGLAPDFTGGHGAFATMHREGRWKLTVYHSIGKGELFDLETDPWEHRNLWNDPAYRDTRDELVLASFNAHVNLTTDVGSERIAPM